MKRKYIFFIFVLIELGSLNAHAQKPTQNISGRVIDKNSGTGLPGANIVVLHTDPVKGAASDENGYFSIRDVESGRISIHASYMGYEDMYYQNLILNSGKELILEIQMEEKVLTKDEIVISARTDKDKSLNSMTSVSSRSFNLEETQRYAGANNDPARMASNYAGVGGMTDERNDIIIRGNSPTGILWRIDGVDVPNPNHFGAQGTTGGPVSMINPNLLTTSDFMTGAFPAEYGNALAGVFDIHLRKGNPGKREYAAQLGYNGLEFMTEGPINKKNRASYLASYRYSFFGLLEDIGMDLGAAGLPEYQDLSIKIDIPTSKAGIFDLIAIGGISKYSFFDKDKDEDDIFDYGERTNLVFGAKTAILALTHTYILNSSTCVKSSVSFNASENTTDLDTIDPVSLKATGFYGQKSTEFKYSGRFVINKKFNARNSLRSGITFDIFDFNLNDSVYRSLVNRYVRVSDFHGSANFIRPFVQWQHKFNSQITLNSGLYYQYFFYNASASLEPRIGLRWELSNTHALNLGYGLHSQLLPFMVYFRKDSSETYMPHKDLDFVKSHHYVFGYDFLITENFRLKSELYFQQIFDAAVEFFPSYFSLLNLGANFGDVGYITDDTSYVNSGTGSNYGIELTLEKFFSSNYYFLLTSSLFESRYKGSDGVERNTAFNGNFVVNLLAGKEIPFSLPNKKKEVTNKYAFFSDIRLTWAGGRPYIPIAAKMISQNPPEYDEEYYYSRAYEKRYPDYFKIDLKIGMRVDKKKISQEWFFDFQNISNYKNILYQSVDSKTGQIKSKYQMPFFFTGHYKIMF